MIQGTASNVGKSVLATALCRVLVDSGYRVAPFKAQNMSLNAAVTPDGKEIGRAQAAQAEAARVAPRAEMNPILLKPEADDRSQVVILGKATGARAARAYWSGRAKLWPIVRSSLRTLRSEFDVVVIEGAGSPAELNLRDHDLVNMRVAREADAGVVLVGDIERGGVFAQLLGTLDLLAPRERSRIRALVVNKFRGDRAIFDGGLRILRRRARLPIHVIPFADDLAVPSEDSLSLRADGADGTGPEIAVVAYPHMSNHDDFEPLAASGARVRYAVRATDLVRPDVVVLPGSKTTRADLAWLRSRGFADRIRVLAAAGTPIIGICGGFQMLGARLRDPDGIEGARGSVAGLGLLPVVTTFEKAKRTYRVRGTMDADGPLGRAGLEFTGYEIHVGATDRNGCLPFAELARIPGGRRVRDGAVSANGPIIGTYAHGLFHNEAVRSALFDAARRRSGRAFTPRAIPSDPYGRLARWLEASIDVRALLSQCGIEVTRATSGAPGSRRSSS